MSVDVVERVRMALAEAGHPDVLVRMEDGRPVVGLDAPIRVTWRALLISDARNRQGKKVGCFACYCTYNALPIPRPVLSPWGGCLAPGEGIEDCGVDRDSGAS